MAFYSLFGLYHLMVLVFIFIVKSEKDITRLFDYYKEINWIVGGSIFGICLFLIDLAWTWFEIRKNKKEQEAMRLENNLLKAKIYDFQEAAKPKPVVKEAQSSDSKSL